MLTNFYRELTIHKPHTRRSNRRSSRFAPSPYNRPPTQSPQPTGDQTLDSRPAWLSRARGSHGRPDVPTYGSLPPDASRKKGRLWVYVAQLLTTPTSRLCAPMPLDVDNGLPGIELWLGRDAASEVGLLMHLDSCAAMNTGNLSVHQWLMTKHPHLVVEYIKYGDAHPFDPLQLACVV